MHVNLVYLTVPSYAMKRCVIPKLVVLKLKGCVGMLFGEETRTLAKCMLLIETIFFYKKRKKAWVLRT